MKTGVAKHLFMPQHNVEYCVGTTKEIYDWVLKIDPDFKEEDDFKGLFNFNGDTAYILINTTHCDNKADQLAVAAHECFHLTSSIMNSIGQEYDPSNHEVFAYTQMNYFRDLIQLIL